MDDTFLEEIIKDFEEYQKNNPKFKHFNDNIKDFIENKFKLDDVINELNKNIYHDGVEGENSYIRKICKEELMGTRVGQTFVKIKKFFYTNNNEINANFKKFKEFLSEIKSILKSNDKNKRERFKKLVIESFSKDALFSLKTVLIQILCCYFSAFLLPIYQLEQMKNFINDLKIEPKKEQEIRIFKSKKNDDFGKKLLLLNKILISWKNKHHLMKKWSNLVFTHFLYMNLPLDDLKVLRKLKLGIEWLETNEQFVVTVFSKIHEKLGFKKIAVIRTNFPDCEVIDDNGNPKLIEFEFESSGASSHKDDLKICDYIVCWENDKPDKVKKYNKNIEIISLKEELRKMILN